jgi:hypothetical protein
MKFPFRRTPSSRTCLVCGEPIPGGAIKCSHCDSYQGWTRHLSRWGTAATAIAALVPLWGIGLALWRLAFPSPADIQFSNLSCGSSELQIAMANVGESVGLVESATFEVERTPPLTDASSDQRSVLPVSPILPLKPNDVSTVVYHGILDGQSVPFPSKGSSQECTYKLTIVTLAMTRTILGGSSKKRNTEAHQCLCSS